jgi:hypothetical protein
MSNLEKVQEDSGQDSKALTFCRLLSAPPSSFFTVLTLAKQVPSSTPSLHYYCTTARNSSNDGATNFAFQGWMGLDKDSANDPMKWQSYQPRTWEETEVDLKITHCGICGF